IDDDKIAALGREHFDLRPKGIVKMLDLLRPIYGKSAAYGHFARDEPEFSWERTDRAEALRLARGSSVRVAISARRPVPPPRGNPLEFMLRGALQRPPRRSPGSEPIRRPPSPGADHRNRAR